MVGSSGGETAQQAHEADTLIEDSIVACLGFEAFRIMGGVTAEPACGLCAGRYAAQTSQPSPDSVSSVE